jgi:hypothetical protein
MGRRWDATLLREALERLRCEQVVDCSNPNVWTSLLSDGTRRMLFLMNFFTGPLTATARIRKPDRNWVDAGTHVVPGISVTVLDDASWPAS